MGCTCGSNFEHEPDELNPRGLTEDELKRVRRWEARLQAWEEEHEEFATVERADAAADAWDQEYLTPEVLAESEREVARIEEDTIPPAKPFPPAPGTTAAEIRRWTLEDAIAGAEEIEDETTRWALIRFGRWADALEAELSKLDLRTRNE